MKIPELTRKTDMLLVLFGLCFVVFGWFSLALALGSLFAFPLIALGMILSGAMAAFIAWKLLARAPIDLRAVFAAAFLYAALVGYFSEPTVFSGRDQGSIAEAAYRLAENGQLAFSTPGSEAFFQIYGPGTALNFPGFAYTESGDLITQFPLGYTSWLAGFFSFFGLSGFAIGNALLLFLFLLLFYGLIRLFAAPFYALWGFILALVSFLPMWFAKAALTENLGIFLFVFLLYNLILYFREGKFVFYAGALLSGGLFAFTRLEGFAFLALALGAMLFSRHTKAIWKAHPWKSLVLPALLFAFFFLRDFFLNLPYYKMAGKGLFKFTDGFANDAVVTASGTAEASALGSVFFLYGLLLVFSVGLFGLFVFIKEKHPILLLPALIALPTFIYLFSPNITLEQPWMLRRYLFSLFPTLLFSAVTGLALLFSRDKTLPIAKPQGRRLFFVTIIFASLLFLQYPAWSKGLFFAEHSGLLGQISDFSGQFTGRDLILVDRFATGNNFAMLTGPAQFLYGKNTVYFFNPEDLDRLDTSRFEHVYLLVPAGDLGRYADAFGERLIFKKNVTFSLKQFENLPLSDDSPVRLPERTVIRTDNLLFQAY